MSFKKYIEELSEDSRFENLNFEPDGRLHYVYRVSHKKENNHYYGSKSELIKVLEETIGCGYYTSSEYLKYDFKDNPEDYKVKVIRSFDNSADKILFESYLHRKFNVKSHDSFINRSNQTPFGFDPTSRKWTTDPIKREKRIAAAVKGIAAIALDPIRAASRSKNMSDAQQRITNDPIRGKLRSENMSKGAIKFQAEIAADPERSASRSKNMSESSIRAHMEIAADPERMASRSKNSSEASFKMQEEFKKHPDKVAAKSAKLSETATKMNEEIANDPEKYRLRSEAQSRAAIKRQAEVTADPKKNKRRSENLSAAQLKLKEDPAKVAHKAEAIAKHHRKSVKQYDLEDNFMEEYRSYQEAAWAVGLKTGAGITTALNHETKTAGGYRWKN